MAPLATTVTSLEVAQLLARYSGAIAGAARPNAKLEAVSTLDDWRRTELPGTLASRSPPHMTKAELYRLVDCKLKRGKSRPTLRLIEGNAEDFVVATTTAAFGSDDVRESFAALLALRGVGPATASYIVAASRFPTVPVFSDEAFRWVVHDGDWTAKIRYDKAEYWDFYGRVQRTAARLGVTEDDVERAGFVLGRDGIAGIRNDDPAPPAMKAAAKGRKRKAAGGSGEHVTAGAGADEKRAKKPRSKTAAITTTAVDPLEHAAPAAGTARSPSRVLRSRTATGSGK